jgi:hypothetical protein
MAESILYRSRAVARGRQGVPAGVPQHVKVNWKGEAGARAMRLTRRLMALGGER